MDIAVLLSGGVDSSVAVHLLCEQGYLPSLFYIRISRDEAGTTDCSMEEDVEICRSVSRRYGHSFRMRDFRFITENPWHGNVGPVEICFKIRHTPEFFTGKLFPCDDKTWLVKADTSIQGIAPGQFGVIYDRAHRLCLGSGEIARL